MVDLCLQSHHYNKERPLMEVYGGDFVICDDGLYESFVEFKKTMDYHERISGLLGRLISYLTG